MWKVVFILWLLLDNIVRSFLRWFAYIFHWINYLFLWLFWLLVRLTRQLDTFFIVFNLLLLLSVKTCLWSLTLRESSWFDDSNRLLVLLNHLINFRFNFFLHFYFVNNFTILLNLNGRLRKQDIFIVYDNFPLIFITGLWNIFFILVSLPWNLERYGSFLHHFWLFDFHFFRRWFHFILQCTDKVCFVLGSE